ncbi:hypothetical protein [Rhizobacter sp. LjRoot28]|jgi:hypothetical protein|uniref:hypothetical protein n=1 Tax=Rhizobacter sp. LjRoot28 TaxID=3342309 RepID=UPI003ECEAC6A
MNLAWMISTGAAVAAGGVLGALVAWQVRSRQARVKQRQLVVLAKEQYVNGTKNLRAANTRLQAALDQEKKALQGRLTAAAAEHRAGVGRLEAQLQHAYAEIERLKASALAIDDRRDPEPVEAHGFALTRPYTR